ncbi:MAG TPA: cell division protein FtsB [Burkholderiaceae bacterium]
MGSRLIPVILLVVLVAIHAQLWLGRGGLPEVAQMRHQLEQQKTANARAQQANERLASEVSDLKEGLGTVEEKARSELGMVKQGEIFVQVTP